MFCETGLWLEWPIDMFFTSALETVFEGAYCGLYYKNITIVNDTSRVMGMTIVGDATTWSDTYGCQLHS